MGAKENDVVVEKAVSTTPSELGTQHEGIVASRTSDAISGAPQRETSEKTDGSKAYTGGGLPFHGEDDQPVPTTWYGKFTRYIRPHGESGRIGFHPWRFCVICFRSSCPTSKLVNRFWVLVPVAFAMHWARPDQELANFILPYLAMIPSANLLGFASGEFAKKLPHIIGVIFETTMGSIVEIVLFIVLIKEGATSVPIIKSAILGSILANLLLCLGACFIAGGLRRQEQEFHEAISEVGSNLMMVAGMGLIVPSVFSASLNNDNGELSTEVLQISRATSIVLLIAYLIYVRFQTGSHESLYTDVLEDEEANNREEGAHSARLTLTEAVVAILFALTMVTFMAIFLVKQIDYLVEARGITEAFLGLILVPLVEKASEHLTAVDEAYRNHCNLALAQVLGSSVQTALLNTPLIVIIGWGIGVPMELNFQIFDSAILILAIIVVGNFLRDGKSNYLEGTLCILVYIIIAMSAFYYPNSGTIEGQAESGPGGE